MVDIVTRAEWGAQGPLREPVPMRHTPSSSVVVHHTGGNERGAAGMRSIQAYHQKVRGWSDIAYSFVIDGDDGVVYEGRGYGIRGGHSLGDVNEQHGVCLMGNFETEPLKVVARNALVALLQQGEPRWWKIHLLGHRQTPGANTACPGRNLYAQLPFIQAAALTPTLPYVFEEDDEMFLYDAPGEPVFFCADGKSVGLNERTDLATFQIQKVKHFHLDDDTFAKFRKAFPGA
jgi:hypothetical protein